MTPFDRALARAERLERECLEWQAALHHAETEARQCVFTGSIREPGPALLAILQERDEARAQAARLEEALREILTTLDGRSLTWPEIDAIGREALASSDSGSWLNERIAAELESWRAARAIKPECVVEVDERIAELRRKEGE